MTEVILHLREFYYLPLQQWVQAMNSFHWMKERAEDLFASMHYRE